MLVQVEREQYIVKYRSFFTLYIALFCFLLSDATALSKKSKKIRAVLTDTHTSSSLSSPSNSPSTSSTTS